MRREGEVNRARVVPLAGRNELMTLCVSELNNVTGESALMRVLARCATFYVTYYTHTYTYTGAGQKQAGKLTHPTFVWARARALKGV